MLWSREQTKRQQKRSTFLKQQPVENHEKAVHLEREKKSVHEKQHAKKETTTSNQQFSPGSEREVVKLLFKNKTNELKS